MTENKAFYLLMTTSLVSVLSPGLYGVLGALGYYVFDILQNRDDFKIGRLLMYGFLGFLIAIMVHDLALLTIKTSYPGLLIASGFSVKKIASIANKWIGVIDKTK